MLRLHEAGNRFVCSGELTAFVFNASRRPNCYVERRSDEQEAYLRRIAADRWFMLREALAIARLHLLRPHVERPELPEAPMPVPPGWYVRQWRRIRGLPDDDASGERGE